MIRASLDANVIVSGVAGLRLVTSTPGEIMRRWRKRDFTLIISDHLLAETRRTLAKPYFRQVLNSAQVASAVHLLRSKAERTPMTVEVVGVASHPEDDLVLATAVSDGARYLVTGDSELLALRRYRGVSIVSARAFLTRLEEDAQPG